MTKLTLSDLANLQNELTAVTTINANNALVETALENTLSRDGTTPNQMSADLDMNSNQILNLPVAVDDTDPVRFLEFEQALNDVSGTGLALSTTGIVVSKPAHGVATRSIVGTTNSIDVTNGDGVSGNPILSVSPSYPGNSNITSVGTVGTGVWNGTKIGLAYGGTNSDLSATGGTSQVLKQNSVGGNVSVAQLAVADLSDTKTGTGPIVLANSPSIVGGSVQSLTNLTLVNSGFNQSFVSGGVLTGNRSLTLNIQDQNSSLTLPASGTLATIAGTEALTNKSVNGLTVTSSTGTLTVPNGVVLTGPATSGTAMTLGNAETVTGVKTFGAAGNVGKLVIAGTTSGSTVLNATAAASGTLTLPAATDTLVGKATTDTLTNKTLTAPVISTITNTGTVTLPTASDTLVARATTDTLTNKTISGASNTISSVALSSLATQAAYTFVGNNTGSSAVPTAVDIATVTSKASPAASDLILISDQAASGAWKRATVSSVSAAGSVSSIAGNTGAFTLANGITNNVNSIELTAARRTLPTFQAFTTGTSATYTTPANTLWIEVWIVGAGGGSGGGGTASQTSGGTGGTSTFNSINAIGGAGGQAAPTSLSGPPSPGGAGGMAGTGTASRRHNGQPGQSGMPGISATYNGPGGAGGGSGLGFGAGSNWTGGAGNAGVDKGGGASGADGGTGGRAGAGGGGGGETAYLIINSPSATYTYTVGAGGTAGSAGTSGTAGAVGAAGYVFVLEHYGS
jgi:hypothetical protein